MNVILRFEPLESDRACTVVRFAPNSYSYRTSRSGDVTGRGDDDAAATPNAGRRRRPRVIGSLAAASLVMMVVGLISLSASDDSSTVTQLTGAEIKTEVVTGAP